MIGPEIEAQDGASPGRGRPGERVPANPALHGLTVLLPWQRWPGNVAPELNVLAQLPKQRDVVVLQGGAEAGERGRYGYVGIPAQVTHLQPGTGNIAAAIDQRLPGTPRVVLLGYELGAPEVFLPASTPPRGQPAGMCIDFGCLLIVDHLNKTLCVVAGRGSRYAIRPQAEAMELLALAHPRPTATHAVSEAVLEPTVDDSEHRRRVQLAREQIAAGNIYQANITRRLRVKGRIHGPSCMAELSTQNPVAHNAYLRLGNLELISNTMETLLAYDPETRLARSFPIKGTMERPSSGAPPAATEHTGPAALAQDPKERSEHVMIVDMVRNDLGRVCEPGSVTVPELMGVYGYRGVWHGVSAVEGKLAPSATLGTLVAALFPGASITGAPKRRSMQIIRELEGESRGFYTGSIGMILPSGCASMSILIRTLVRDQGGWSLSVGGGIVADSNPQREVNETWEKVAVFKEVLRA